MLDDAHPEWTDTERATIANLVEMLWHGPAPARWHAAERLATSGAVDVLIEALGQEDEVLRSAAVEALGGIGPAGITAVPALVRAMQDQNRSVDLLAIIALGKIGPGASDAVPALCAALKHPCPNVRVQAAHALAHIGPDARAATAALREVLLQEDMRCDALYALQEIERLPPAVPA